jgi:hypothetical protein
MQSSALLQLLVLAGKPSAQLSPAYTLLGSTSLWPLGHGFDLSICRAQRFSTASLCLYYFLLYEVLRFRLQGEQTQRPAKAGPTAQAGTVHCALWNAEHRWVQVITKRISHS